MPLATVLIPNYNGSAYLQEAIDSVLNQTFRDYEVLMVDDGSTDDSVTIAQNIKNSKFRFIKKKPNSGIVDTLNMGIDQIDSRYMIRMDSDDISLPHRIETLVRFMEKNPKFAVLSSAYKQFGYQNSTVTPLTDPKMIKAGLIHGTTIPHPAAIFRSDVFVKNHLRYSKEHLHIEDFVLYHSLKKEYDFKNISNILYKYRTHSSNITTLNRTSLKDRIVPMFQQILLELGMNNERKQAEIHYEYFYVNTFSYQLDDFIQHYYELREANLKTSIYPRAEFNRTLKKYWNMLACRFITNDPSSYSELKKSGIPLRLYTRYYYFRTKNKR